MLGAKLHAGRSFQGNSCSTTCPSFCMSVQRSSTSVPHWPAACTHAWAYCPATELCRLRGHSGNDKKSNDDLCRPWEHDLCDDTTREGWGMGIKFTFQDTLFLPGWLMNGWRGDEYYSVCGHTSRSKKLGDLLQVLWILLHRDMLLGVFICKTEIKGWFHKETLEWLSFQEQRWKGYSANSKWLLLTSMGQGCQWNRIRDKERGMSLGGTFKCTVVCPKEDGDSSYVVCWVLTADDAREDYLGPSRIIPRQSSVYNVTLSEGKIDVRIMNRDVTPAQFSVDTKVWILLW